MPIFTLVTNLDEIKINNNVLRKISETVGEMFDGTEQNVCVTIKAGVQMAWGTKPGLFALGTLQNTIPFDAEVTKKFAPQIFELIENLLGIPQNRMYLGFISINPDNIAEDGLMTSLKEKL